MNILTLTGGGLFGTVQAAILERSGLNITEEFDAVAGTSAGAANAIYIASGKSTTDLVAFYTDAGPRIFSGFRVRRFNPLTPKYPDEELNRVLSRAVRPLFGDLHLPTIITAANLATGRPKVWYSKDRDAETWPAWEIARASMAAPTYFIPWRGFADGGIYFNDPTLAATLAIHRVHETPFSEMRVFGIGTGLPMVQGKTPSTRGWSVAHWGAVLIRNLLSGGAVHGQRMFARNLGFAEYIHREFMRPDAWSMDDPRTPARVLKHWAGEIDQAAAALRDFVGK